MRVWKVSGGCLEGVWGFEEAVCGIPYLPDTRVSGRCGGCLGVSEGCLEVVLGMSYQSYQY